MALYTRYIKKNYNVYKIKDIGNIEYVFEEIYNRLKELDLIYLLEEGNKKIK